MADADFEDFMQRQAAKEAAAARQEEMHANHELWRQTTWAGWLTTIILGLTELPFFQAISSALEDQKQGKSGAALLLTNFVRLSIIFAVILAFYVAGKILQKIIGEDIEVHEEVIITHEISRSQYEKEQKEGIQKEDQPVQRRGAREKKTN
mmetsp:Transcript_15502/g.24138  ORF Transcript_15502/g.24138 Transcript_15502/m.24138 type:complete len:151 (-) Transcript_15502:2356-2808(-)|eukprot:CAMPEP_0195262830 /NCGR_PEP_ID=MMETSP0706-20130129/9973_1 /TAXON_ID=33640 /ORGANISM="Asterionellopsis glacialis, Strain CCMP134" /LENGTH=150 /DNA_ID=CAMNT_0040316955 /DNA_START=12 /DNA_END=464 /DNA_ORIENTATION=-